MPEGLTESAAIATNVLVDVGGDRISGLCECECGFERGRGDDVDWYDRSVLVLIKRTIRIVA